MKLFISADVEGVAGIVSWNQITPGSEDYSVGRSLMEGEVNAAIEGAMAAGVDHIVVNDSHGRMANLRPEKLDPRASLVTGHYKPMYMLQGLDESFDAVFFVGYHGAIGQPEAILSHTYNPRAIWEARVDGRVVGEIGINALVCGYFGTPIRLVTGDQVTAREASDFLPDVRVAEVKRSFSRYSAESLSPSAARELIRREAEAALRRIPATSSATTASEIELTFLVADMAEMATWVRGVEQVGPRTVRFASPDGLEAYRRFYAIVTLTRSLVE